MPDQQLSDDRRFRRQLTCLVVATLLVRGTVLLATHDRLREDPDHYGILAANLASQGTLAFFPPRATAFRPPLYPLLLAPLSTAEGPAPLGVALLHLALAAGTVAALTLLARQYLNPPAALFAGALVLVDPLLLYQSSQVMTETLAAFLVAAVLLAAGRLSDRPTLARAALVGSAAGLACLCRPTFLPWVPVLAAGAWLTHTAPRRPRWVFAGLLLLCAAVPVTVWTTRNVLQFGKPIAATTHGGYTLWLANNEDYYEFLRSADFGATWNSAEFDRRRLAAARKLGFDELAADRHDHQQALATIRKHPAMFLYSGLRRVGALWSPLPHARRIPEPFWQSALRHLIAGWYLALFTLAALGLWQLGRATRRLPWFAGISLLLIFTAVHAVYWSNLRMRAPLIPVVALLAAVPAARRSGTTTTI